MRRFCAPKGHRYKLWFVRRLTVLPLLVSLSTVAFPEDAQLRNEFAIGVGRTFISDQRVPNTSFFDNSVHSGKGLSFSFNYTRQFLFFRWGAVGVEVPVIYNPDEDLNYGLNVVPKQYSSVFATPALHLSFVRNFFISPWLSFGGGVGHFVADKELEFNNTPNPGPRIKTTGVMHGGIGFDVPLPKKLLDLRFRFEARDNWSGEPPVNVNTGRTRQHNYYVGGGVVFRF